MRRVVITGMGAVSPHGIGAPAFWGALVEGRSSISALTRFDSSAFPSQVAGTVPAFKTTDYVPKSYRKATKIMARDIELAVIAAELAVRDAKVITKGVMGGVGAGQAEGTVGWFQANPKRFGCNIGAGLICADLDELTLALTQARGADNSLDMAKWGHSEDVSKTSGMENLTPLWLLKYLPNMLACHVSIIHDTQGPSNTITCGQSSAGLALSEAVRTIQRGHADMALVGGCESRVNPMGLARWSLLNRLNTTGNADPATACRPYDEAAAGAVIAEGGAVMVIEAYEHAVARGATIYAEVAGLGASANVQLSIHEPDPAGESSAMAMKKAMKDAGIGPKDIGMVIPPGYGIASWDRADAAALREAFGSALNGMSITAARAGIGDCGAGAQALDLVAAAMALKEGVVPPTANTTKPISGLPLATKKTPKEMSHVMVLATAVGGQNSAVVLKKV